MVMHEAPCVCPTCGATKFGRIGADERMVLEYVPFVAALTVRDVRLAALSRSSRECAPRLQPAVFFRQLVELQWDLSS
jgi:hypothetical protein